MKNLLFVLSFLCSLCLQAKDGKIKYAKNVIYEGGIENKQPHGHGVLKITDPYNEKINDTEISGLFEGNKVSDAKIVTKYMYNKIINISNLNINVMGDKGKYTGVEIIIDKATIASEFKSAILKIPSIEVDYSTPLSILKFQIKDKFAFYTGMVTGYSGAFSPDTLSPVLSKLQYNKGMVNKAIETFHLSNKGFESTSYKNARKNPFSYIFFILNDDSYAIGNKIFYANKDSVVVNENSWSGTCTLSDKTKVSSDSVSKKLNIIYSNGETYTGTIKEGLLYPLYVNVNEAKFTYDTGTHTANGVVTKWVNGETFEARHERLKSVLNEKWLAMVEEEKVSEQEAIDGQRAEKEKREKDKERKDLCAKILWDKWKCKQIVFKGDLGASSIGNALGLAGIDHTYFEGFAILTLDDNGRAVWGVLAEPSSRQMNRMNFKTVVNTCDNYINKTVDGEWYLEGNKVFISGVNQYNDIGKETNVTLILSNDGKTLRYDSLLGATLKIIDISQKSVRKDE